MRIALLTGGGDCPGLNAAIRAVVRKAPVHGIEVLGVRKGWRGLLDVETVPLDLDAVSGILPRGGTILHTSRTNPYRDAASRARLLDNIRAHGLDAVIAIGGEDTLGVAARLHEDGVRVVGVPKTIDNDLRGTDQTFGFDTAVAIACEAIDRLHTTAESHDRVMVVEVMGRAAGWIAVASGLAAGADAVLVPEFPLSVEEVCAIMEKRSLRGRDFSIVVVAEGARPLADGRELSVRSDETDAFGHPRLGGISHVLAREIERRTGHEARVTILGHVQRGGTPTAFDRLLATRLGAFACDLCARGESGVMAALRGTEIVAVSLKEAAGGIRTLDPALWELARSFFG
jgi:ATP-dependent phosphofructokinase / diphosphate-dependent phosphofructokinase